MSAADALTAVQARADQATPGPWVWRGNTDAGDVHLAGHLTRAGRVEVLGTIPVERTTDDLDLDEALDVLPSTVIRADLEHSWTSDPWTDGTRTDQRLCLLGKHHTLVPARDLAVYEVARARGLPDDTPRDHPGVYRADIVDVRHPDARFIAAARTDVPALAGALSEVLALCDEWNGRPGSALGSRIRTAIENHLGGHW